MRLILPLMAILLSFSFGINAQNSTKKNKFHKVWIKTLDGSKESGILHSVDESSVNISKNNYFDIENLTYIDRENIDVIKIRRKGKIGKGAWIGAASGAGFGVILGLATEDSNWEGAVSTASGLFFGLVGTGVGAAVGSVKKKVKINGEPSLYKDNLDFLQSISLVTNNSMEK
jgi:hypothetical protein